jgi:hypothetical protein
MVQRRARRALWWYYPNCPSLLVSWFLSQLLACLPAETQSVLHQRVIDSSNDGAMDNPEMGPFEEGVSTPFLLLQQHHRYLRQDAGGNTALTILYLCLLGLCFATPLLYYIRLHYDERNAERAREAESQAIRRALADVAQEHWFNMLNPTDPDHMAPTRSLATALAGLVNDNENDPVSNMIRRLSNSWSLDQGGLGREQLRHQRRKILEERRARLRQLLAPVRMVGYLNVSCINAQNSATHTVSCCAGLEGD